MWRARLIASTIPECAMISVSGFSFSLLHSLVGLGFFFRFQGPAFAVWAGHMTAVSTRFSGAEGFGQKRLWPGSTKGLQGFSRHQVSIP